jgi:Glycosyl transferase family 2
MLPSSYQFGAPNLVWQTASRLRASGKSKKALRSRRLKQNCFLLVVEFPRERRTAIDSALLIIRVLLAVLLAGLAGAGWLVWQMLQQRGRLLLRLETLETGVADKQAQGLRSPVALDLADRSVGKRSDATGTPAVVLVDTKDRIASEAESGIELTIGMATYNDFDGVYFSLQALRLYQDLDQTELLVIDNYGCEYTKKLVEKLPNGRYIRAMNAIGTAAPRDLVFQEARGKAVLCCDCHVLFPPGVIARLKQFYREHPACQDLLQGPLLYDDGKRISTHFDPVWRAQMWGTWGTDPRGRDPEGEPFEIPMQGLGVFSCLKSAWLGFHPDFRGFGGEEGYIHEKFRQAGRHCLCLPWLRWMHRFGRPSGVKYPLTVNDKLRNYVLGHTELGLDLAPVLYHFSDYLPEGQAIALAERLLGGRWTGSAFICEEDPGQREKDGPRYLRETSAQALHA